MAPQRARDGLSAQLRPYVEDDELIVVALTHRSYCAEHPGAVSNERLEFLGDAVLGLAVTASLYRTHPGLAEGDLARIRAAVVSTAALAPVAAALGLGAGLRLGRGEESSGGRAKPSLLADALEAVLGAVYLASGIERATECALSLLGPLLAAEAAKSAYGDAKNRLQELAARSGEEPPVYSITERGPDHAKRFRAEVRVAGVDGAGEGPSKKDAERRAAEAVLDALSGA